MGGLVILSMDKKSKGKIEDILRGLFDVEDFRKALSEIVEPKDRCQIYLQLLPYIAAKRQAITQEITTTAKDDAEKLIDSLLIGTGMAS